MKRSSGAGRLTALSTVMAGVLMASAACGSPASSERSVTAAAEGTLPRITSVNARPADADAKVTGVDAQPASSKAADSGSSGAGTAVERCRTGALAARVGAVDAGAGQRYAPLVVTNRSARACWVYGFVGLIMIDRNGDALRTRTRRESVQPRRVTLRPGAGAHARIHWTEVRSGRETRCPTSARLMIIPPDEVAHLEIPFTATVCDDGRLDITPMAPGTRL
ncbi:DUF4232 domain-containing protein [Streptosporangium roseum]|uniref:DUF4232 domain-containing protein n=1 Tax=Streptosporangium roseum (strain ATCC 12428 / DSM 43021 / JCM 3005 / KCTC 9067 / NCIMB 10171 / NRRL 2505 / NI 9100) TaxID=479432 RepID=D2BBQ6_STRRD|nr:DUF4232 domain-containing protein [Streptosporangium roseum]ACZ86125.1 hypothetical protein Sros_3180 [Streptosporangium roseum DSM 43021]